jgi:LysM repeat protein
MPPVRGERSRHRFHAMNRTVLRCASAAALLLALPSLVEAQTLSGSRASVDRIYRQAINHDLRFFPTAASVREAHRRGELVLLEGNADYTLVAVSYPYLVPAAHTFVVRLASQYRAACGEQLVVTSATRPTSFRLPNSVDRSVHPTGMAVDFRRPTNSRCLSWLRQTLLSLEAAGVLEAVEERNPPHFHVAVFPSQYANYVGQRAPGGTLVAATVARSTPAAAVPSGTYEVRRGDSLWTIAQRTNTTVDRLKEANDLQSSRILAGQVLVIPADAR